MQRHTQADRASVRGHHVARIGVECAPAGLGQGASVPPARTAPPWIDQGPAHQGPAPQGPAHQGPGHSVPAGPVPVALAEVSPSSLWCQRWTGGTHTWRHRHDGGFDSDAYFVDAIPEAVAKEYVTTNHYSASYPAAQHRFGLFEPSGALLGVCVFGVPMQAKVLTNVFPDLEAMVESVELSRLVLADTVAANGESWFLARCFSALSALDVKGVVTFADPVPRVVAGRLLFPGHVGIIYQATNAQYLGRATPRTLTILPDGRILSDRSAQKIRSQDRGHEHVERMLISLGASTPNAGTMSLRTPAAKKACADWLVTALDAVGATRLRHQGNHRYAFTVGNARTRRAVRVQGVPGAYPKAVG